jgi:hypothetical protein
MKMNEFLNVLKTNQRLVASWSIAIVLAISTWAFLTRKSPSAAVADEPAPTASATPAVPAIAPVVITPVAPKPSISITSSLSKPAGAMDEYSYMARLNNLQGERLAKFDRVCAEREVAINYWGKGPGKQVEDVRSAMKAAKAAKDDAAVAELQAKHDLLNQMDIDYRTMLRASVMAELTLEHQRRWAGFVINAQVVKKLSRIELSDRQKEFIQRLADESADRLIKADTVEKDPFLASIKTAEVVDPIVKQTRDKILTIEQRARLPQPGKNGSVILTR